MSNFGDVRSAVQAHDEAALKVALLDGNNDMSPVDLLRYVGTDLLVSLATWSRGDKRTSCVVQTIDLDEGSSLCLELPRFTFKWPLPYFALQRAVLPIRRETIDAYWRPWANDHQAARQTGLIDNALLAIDSVVHRCGSRRVWDEYRDRVNDATLSVMHDVPSSAAGVITWCAVRHVLDAAIRAAEAANDWHPQPDLKHDLYHRVNKSMIAEALS